MVEDINKAIQTIKLEYPCRVVAFILQLDSFGVKEVYCSYVNDSIISNDDMNNFITDIVNDSKDYLANKEFVGLNTNTEEYEGTKTIYLSIIFINKEN